MTPDSAKYIRDMWEKAGNKPCDDMVLVLEKTTNGYLTGQYVCTNCGREICRTSK
jgi:hypothetical protein